MPPSKPSPRSAAMAAALATPPPTIVTRVPLTASPAGVHVDRAVVADLALEGGQARVVRVDALPGHRVELPQVLGAGQRLAVQVALVQAGRLVRAPVGI